MLERISIISLKYYEQHCVTRTNIVREYSNTNARTQVHCLRILGVTRTKQVEEQDKEIFKLVDLAVDFLLDTEIQNGKCGEWVPRKRSTKAYDKYHAAYCGVVGLLDAPPPIPKDDNVLMKRWFMTLRARDNNDSE